MIRRLIIFALLASAAFAQPKPAPAPPGIDAASPPGQARINAALNSDPVLRAILEEISRARRITTLGETIYYIEVSVDDAESFSVGATLGAAFAPTRARFRPLRAQVRVGSPKLDNTNSIFSDYFSGSRFGADSLPLDNDPIALRHTIWLSLDRAYKTAAEAIGRKSAALRGVTVSDPLPDYWTSPPRALIEEPRRAKIDEDVWTARVRALSSVFLDYPDITNSSVDFESSQGAFYHANTTGAVVRTPDRVAYLRVRASRQAPDGMVIYDGAVVQSLDPSAMPAEAELRKTVDGVARNVMALSAAPVGQAYSGPVLFAGAAAPQVISEIVGAHLGVMRRPVSEPGRAIPTPISEFDGRIGARVLPEWMDLVDDPTLASHAKRPLLGHYDVDQEGIFPQPLTLVENGILKTLLTSRQPIRGVTGPNGRARLPGVFGVKFARSSNLFLRSRKSEPEAQLKSRLINLIRQQNRPFGIIVRKMDFPSSGSADDLRRLSARAGRSGGGGRPVSSPVLLYRVYPDGREELLRGLRFRGFTTRAFRDILAAGDQEHQFDFLDNAAPLALMGVGNYIVGCSTIAPSLLFQELELEPDTDDLPKPPVVPPPPLAAAPAPPQAAGR
ncbi:MAG: hypothetical protein HY858_07155 [Candidatus Solibacter usitatus]|nr:hypothetical protein [Candidatus Solibacter usitatus]